LRRLHRRPARDLARRLALPGPPETDAASDAVAASVFANQFDTGGFEGGHDLDQGVDIAADVAVARLHPLDRRQGNARALGERLLVQANQSASRAQLRRRQHGLNSHLGFDFATISYL
jgi:hypothetical protein